MTHLSVWHNTLFCVSDLGKSFTLDVRSGCVYDMTHHRVRYDLSFCVTWHIILCFRSGQDNNNRRTFRSCNDSPLWLLWRTHGRSWRGHRGMCDMTYSYVWHDSFICVTWLFFIVDCHEEHMGTAGEATEVCVTWRIRMCDMSPSYVRHESSLCMTWVIPFCDMWIIRMCDMTYSHVWHDFFEGLIVVKSTWVPLARPQRCVWHAVFVCMKCLLPIYHTNPPYVWHESFLFVTCESFVCVTWRIRVYEMFPFYVWRDSFFCMTWCIPIYDINHCSVRDMTHSCVWHTHSYVWHDLFVCVTYRIHVCDTNHLYVRDMTHFYVWHDSFLCVWLIHVWHDSFFCMTWRIPICDVNHPYGWHDSFLCVTWLIRMCGMTHFFVWRDAFLYVP